MDIFGWRCELTVARRIEAGGKERTEVYSENKKQANNFKRVWNVGGERSKRAVIYSGWLTSRSGVQVIIKHVA